MIILIFSGFILFCFHHNFNLKVYPGNTYFVSDMGLCIMGLYIFVWPKLMKSFLHNLFFLSSVQTGCIPTGVFRSFSPNQLVPISYFVIFIKYPYIKNLISFRFIFYINIAIQFFSSYHIYIYMYNTIYRLAGVFQSISPNHFQLVTLISL